MASSSVSQYIEGKLTGTYCIAFDLDDTLIWGTQSSGYNDYPGAKNKLIKLHEEGANLLIFSNQKRPKQSDSIVNAKIEALILLYPSIPFHIFCAREDDDYRKPNIGMLKLVPSSYGPIKLFIGDADGTEGAHSDADIGFATMAKIPFKTPEEYFNTFSVLNSTEYPNWLKADSKIRFLTLILLVGYPASGKSTYCKNVLPHIETVSRDQLGTMTKCLKQTQKLLEAGSSVIIDNLNESIEKRQPFIKLANDYGASITIIHFLVPMAKAQARNIKRNDKKRVPNVVFYTFRKHFELPSVDEDIDDFYSVIQKDE